MLIHLMFPIVDGSQALGDESTSCLVRIQVILWVTLHCREKQASHMLMISVFCMRLAISEYIESLISIWWDRTILNDLEIQPCPSDFKTALFPDKLLIQFLKTSEKELSALVKHPRVCQPQQRRNPLPNISPHSCCSWSDCALIGDGKI